MGEYLLTIGLGQWRLRHRYVCAEHSLNNLILSVNSQGFETFPEIRFFIL